MNKIEIKNFQSHRSSTLNLSPGINLLTGNSDCGKSAVMRAILWTITNKPSGDSYVGNAIKDTKGKMKGETSVSIDGVARVRNRDYNGYLMGDQRFEALRTDVPKDIQDVLNIKEVNIQRQLDGPFMLSNTPGENAKYINNLVNLEVIDQANYWVGSKIRDAKSEQKFIQDSIDSTRRKLYDDAKVESLGSIIEETKRLTSILDNILSEVGSLESEIGNYEHIIAYMPDADKVQVLESLVEGISANMQIQLPTYLKIKDLQDTIRSYVDSDFNMPDVNKVLRLEYVNGYIDKATETKTDLNALIAGLSAELTTIESTDVPDAGKVYRLEEIVDFLSESDERSKAIMDEIGSISRESVSYHSSSSKIMHIKPALEDAEEELKQTACPLCGRRDCSDGYRNWIDR